MKKIFEEYGESIEKVLLHDGWHFIYHSEWKNDFFVELFEGKTYDDGSWSISETIIVPYKNVLAVKFETKT